MKKITQRIAVLGIMLAMTLPVTAQQKYVGGDISSLPSMEEAGAKYKTHDGKAIPDVLEYCKQEGMNAMRVRLFVNPTDYDGSDKDPNACQDLEYIIPLCQRIKNHGLDLILDFMYSDTWADPAKQWTPKSWENLSDEELYVKINEYTKDCLTQLKNAGVVPDFIQTGNEISYGMLWGPHDVSESQLKKCFMGNSKNWDRFGKLLNNAIAACREVCPEAKIIIHTERISQVNVQKNFYQQMEKLNVDYDIIGVSYYPYFHGTMNLLDAALTELETDFPEKDIMVVETGYPLEYEIPGTTEKVDYPYTDAGQNQYVKDLVAMLLKHNKVDGLFWWWMEYNAYGTTLTGWYNAPLFNSKTGCATSAFQTICSFAKGSGIPGTKIDDPNKRVLYYDLNGVPVNSKKPNGESKVILGTDGSKYILK